MKWRLISAVIATLGAIAGAMGAAGLAIAQGPWTTVTKDDLAICAPIFDEVHRLELIDYQKNVMRYCTNGDRDFDEDTCKDTTEGFAESQARNSLDWFYEGNARCEGSDYPCFGPALYNTPRMGEEADRWINTFTDDARKPARVTPDMTLRDAAFEGDRCIAQVWVRKYRAGGGTVGLTPPQAPVASAPVAAPTAVAKKVDPVLASCLDGQGSAPEKLATCGGVMTAMKPDQPDYGALAIALMQMNAGADKHIDALRYGDMFAALQTGEAAQAARCAVRVIVKWDLDAALAACRAGGPANPAALEATGQIHLLAGRWQDAWTAFDTAYKAGQAGQALYLRGLAAAAQGRMGEALKDMADGEAKAPGTAQAYDRDGYSMAVVAQGKPLAPPEAFAAAAPAPVAPSAAAPSLPPPPPPAMLKFDPDAPRGVPVSLSAAEMQACEDDIRSLQADSKSWQGTIDEISVKLGMLQRTIYATRCAGHPQAANLQASAERMIADASARADLAPMTAAQTSPFATDCLTPAPLGDASNTTRSSVFRNTCAFPVMVTYCNVASAPGSWAESFACETRAHAALVNVPANGEVSVVFGRQINHLGCKMPALPVAKYTQAAGLEGFCK